MHGATIKMTQHCWMGGFYCFLLHATDFSQHVYFCQYKCNQMHMLKLAQFRIRTRKKQNLPQEGLNRNSDNNSALLQGTEGISYLHSLCCIRVQNFMVYTHLKKKYSIQMLTKLKKNLGDLHDDL